MVGFEADAPAPPADARDALLTRMRPELVNRIDGVVSFNPLDEPALRRIVDRYVAGIEDLLSARELTLELEDDVYDRLIELGTSREYGARELRRAVDVHLRQPLAAEILRQGDEIAGIRVSADGEEIRFEAVGDLEATAG